MHVNFQIDTGNDAFAEAPLRELLKAITRGLEHNASLQELDGQKLYDSNGNHVGAISLVTKVRLPDAKPSVTHDPRDIICYLGGKWWFYDETWTETLGPYTSRAEAEHALKNYCATTLFDRIESNPQP